MPSMPPVVAVNRGALLSADGIYRYTLTRQWGAFDAPRVCFIMLNPSTADAQQDDPTVRRCIAYARAWEFGGLEVVNLFALRATDPRQLARHPSPLGPGNNDIILTIAAGCRRVVAAWGTGGTLHHRGEQVLRMLRGNDIVAKALRITKDGHPAHPLYLPASLEPFEL